MPRKVIEQIEIRQDQVVWSIFKKNLKIQKILNKKYFEPFLVIMLKKQLIFNFFYNIFRL